MRGDTCRFNQTIKVYSLQEDERVVLKSRDKSRESKGGWGFVGSYRESEE